MRLQFLVLILLLSSGCQIPREVTFGDWDGYGLLKAARLIQVGDTRRQVIRRLGWRRDQAFVEGARYSADDGGGLIHPRLNIWHWQSYPVSLLVDFGDDGRVYQVRYYDDTKQPDGPFTLTMPAQGS